MVHVPSSPPLLAWRRPVSQPWRQDRAHLSDADVVRLHEQRRLADRVVLRHRTAFEQLLHEPSDGFAAAAVVSVAGEDRLDPREAARLSAAAAQQIKGLDARSGRAEVHLAFHGPDTMALLVGRYLNALRTVVYERDRATPGRTRCTPALVLEPGVTSGPITEVLLGS